MDYTALRVFVAVARAGNLTRAAERLYMTQPALSLQIKKLQSELDLVLFERTPQGMRLTELGYKLLPSAERALAAMAEFRAAGQRLKGQLQGDLSMGTIVDPEFLRLGDFLGLLAERYPDLRFELRHGMSGAVAEAVEAGQLDTAYTLGCPGFVDVPDWFYVEPLASFTYRVIAPAGWADKVRGKGWRELAALPWIATPDNSVHARLLGRIFAAEGIEPNIVARVDLEPSMLDLVKSGVALALARHNLALQAVHVHGIVMADAVAVDAELGFLCRRDRQAEPIIAAALEVVREVWQKS